MRRLPSWRSLMPWFLAISLLCNVAVLAGYLLQPLFGQAELPTAPEQSAPQESAVSNDKFVSELARATALEPAQVEEITQSRAALMSSLAPLRESMKAVKHRLVQLMVAETPDMEALRAATQEIAQSQKEMQDRTVDHLLLIRKGLKAHQRAGFDRLLQERMCPNPLCTGACIGGCAGCAMRQGEATVPGAPHECGCGGGGALPFDPGIGGGSCPHAAAGPAGTEGYAGTEGGPAGTEGVPEPSCHGVNP